MLAPQFVTDMRINDTQTSGLVVAGEEAYVSARLVPFPGSLLVIQKRADVMRAWRESVEQVSLLFVSTFLVLDAGGGVPLAGGEGGGGRHDAASPPNGSTWRSTAAIAACGTGTSRMARYSGRSPCMRSSACQEKGEFLSFGEVAERIHPDDAPLEGVVEELACAASATLFDQEFRIRHTDGHWVWLRARAARRRAKRRRI